MRRAIVDVGSIERDPWPRQVPLCRRLPRPGSEVLRVRRTPGRRQVSTHSIASTRAGGSESRWRSDRYAPDLDRKTADLLTHLRNFDGCYADRRQRGARKDRQPPEQYLLRITQRINPIVRHSVAVRQCRAASGQKTERSSSPRASCRTEKPSVVAPPIRLQGSVKPGDRSDRCRIFVADRESKSKGARPLGEKPYRGVFVSARGRQCHTFLRRRQ